MYEPIQRRSTKENDLIAMEFLRSGMTIEAFAKMKGIPKGSIGSILQRRGIRVNQNSKRNCRAYSEAQKKAFVKEFLKRTEADESLSQVRYCMEKGIGGSTFKKYLSDYYNEVRDEILRESNNKPMQNQEALKPITPAIKCEKVDNDSKTDWLDIFKEEEPIKEPRLEKKNIRPIALRITTPSMRIECYRELSAEEILTLSQAFSKIGEVSIE